MWKKYNRRRLPRVLRLSPFWFLPPVCILVICRVNSEREIQNHALPAWLQLPGTTASGEIFHCLGLTQL
jgi:hypothetical protein